ncbi:MAG: hypothetical protein ABSG42_03470, partial [Nitrospirota bacterium]
LPKEPRLSPDAAGKFIKEKVADNLLTVATTPAKTVNRTFVELVLDDGQGRAALSLEGTVDSTSEVYSEKVGDYSLVRGEHRDFYHMDQLPYRARLMAAGNLTGKGMTELAVSDGVRIIIYRLEQGNLKELWRDEGSVDTSLDIECADLNGNGTDELYVTRYGPHGAASYVIEYDGQNFKKVFGPVPLFFRILDIPGKGKRLITTSVGKDAPYSGIIDEYKWEGGRLVDGGRFDLPGKIKDIYGFVLVDLIPSSAAAGTASTSGKEKVVPGPQIVWVDDADYIQVLDAKGKKLWKSPERYGGYDNFFELGDKDLSLANVDDRGKVKGKLTVRSGPDGDKEIVITKNIAMTHTARRFRGYSGAEIYSFSWDGEGLSERWSIKNIEGYLADISVGDVSNNGREEIAIITDPTFKLEKKSKNLPLGGAGGLTDIFAAKSSLLIYKVPQR